MAMTSVPPPAPRKRGCFFYGCLTVVVLSLVGILMLFLTYRYLAKVSADLIDDAPIAVERVEVDPARLDEVQRRVMRFGEALEKQERTEELELTAEDINTLIAASPQFKEVRDRLFVRLEEDRIKGKVSVPLQDVGPFKMKGRYLNGEATFKLSLAHGQLQVTLMDIEVKGRPLPGVFMRELRKVNLADEAMKDPNTAQNLSRFESIEVRDGKVILRNKVTP